MPPKKAVNGDSPEAPTGLTTNELRFIKAVFDNMTQKPDADWTCVANDLGLKDAKCAKERFRQMSVRHGWRDGSATSPRKDGKDGATAPSGNGKVTKKPHTTTPKKRTKKASPSDGEDDSSAAASIKKEEEDEKMNLQAES